MLISNNNSIESKDFEKLIAQTTVTLQEFSKNQNERYLKLLGNKLENEVFDVMCSCAENTPFENTIELVSGQKFPDIVANNYYGVEVKSTKQNHWRTTGNSVLEHTRIKDIERIYMLFGKIYNPIEFKCRLYQECLSEVLVTHSPRYAIDMNLQEGDTIFNKIGIDYDTLRQQSNPIKPFKDYYRSKLSEGQELWWMENEEYKPESLVFRVWNTLSKDEKDFFKIKGFALFPDILSKKQTKFDNFTLWLSVKNRIICPNVRDLYTAGGKRNIVIDGHKLYKLPRVLYRFIVNIEKITEELKSIDLDTLNELWNTSYTSKVDALSCWICNVEKAASENYDFKSYNFKNWLEFKFNNKL